MKKLFFIALFPVYCFGSVSSIVQNIINDSVVSIETAEGYLNSAKSDASLAASYLEQLGTSDISLQTNQSFVSAYELLTPDTQGSVPQQINWALDSLSSTKSSLRNIDLSGLDSCCTNCEAKLDRILSLVDTNSSKLDSLEQSVSRLHTKVDDLDLAIYSISNMVYDLSNDGGSGDPGSSGSGGSSCGCADVLGQILQILIQVRDLTLSIELNVDSWSDGLIVYLNWFNAIKDDVTEYYKLLNSRYKKWDGRMQENLKEMWEATQAHILEVTDNVRYTNWTINEALNYALNDRGNSKQIELSTEGYIQLHSLTVQERQYLTQLDIANSLRAITNGIFSTGMNTNDLWWAMRYYMDYNNQYSPKLFTLQNPYQPPEYYKAVSNFFGKSISETGNRFQSALAYNQFLQKETNWFNRVELYLMNMNGLLLPSGGLQEIEENTTEDSFENTIRYATNDFANAINSFADTTNQLKTVVNSFSSLLDSFQFSMNGATSHIILIPSFTLFGVQFDTVQISVLALEDITKPVHQLFGYLWYIIFALISFKLFLKFLYVVGKLVGQTVIIISTFMGGS